MGVTDLHHRLMVCSPCPQHDVNSTRSEGQSISSLHNSHEDGIRKLTQFLPHPCQLFKASGSVHLGPLGGNTL